MTKPRLDFDDLASRARSTLDLLDRHGGGTPDVREGLELGCRVAAVMTPDERRRARDLSSAEMVDIARRASASEDTVTRLFERFARV